MQLTRIVKLSDLHRMNRWTPAAFVGTRTPPRGVFPGEGYAGKALLYEATGEYRAPRKGEWYLSGAIVEAWRAPNDLSLEFWIAVPAKPKPIQVCALCRKDWTEDHVCARVKAGV